MIVIFIQMKSNKVTDDDDEMQRNPTRLLTVGEDALSTYSIERVQDESAELIRQKPNTQSLLEVQSEGPRSVRSSNSLNKSLKGVDIKSNRTETENGDQPLRST